MLSDIEIAQRAKPLKIQEIAGKLGITDSEIEPYGKFKAKLSLHLVNEHRLKSSNLILVSAISPTPAGEGKTTPR